MKASVGPAGGSGAIRVATDPRCAWAVVSNAGWIALRLSPGALRMGPGEVQYTIGPWPESRSGTITVAGQNVTITQGPAVSLAAVANAASYAQGPVSPGEILVLFGAGLGPAALATLALSPDGQYVTTSVAGTRVLFDGAPAPVIYTSESQVSAIAPYGLEGKSSTDVQVEHNGNVSNAVRMQVARAAPGIFTLDQSGRGPGAILNQDYSVNTPANPAARGSAVMIYATGEGQTEPAGADGKVAGEPLPAPLGPVSVVMGGIEADVLYAGAAPGLVSGLLQVNARVPGGIEPGSAIHFVVRVGGFTSQGGATIAVR